MVNLIAVCIFLFSGLSLYANQDASELPIVINTYSSTCRGANPITSCILQKTRKALATPRLGPYSNSMRDNADPKKLSIEFVIHDGSFYKLELLASDAIGWQEDYEIVMPKDDCGIYFGDGIAEQVFHSTKQMDSHAKIFKKTSFVPPMYEAVLDVDIEPCL